MLGEGSLKSARKTKLLLNPYKLITQSVLENLISDTPSDEFGMCFGRKLETFGRFAESILVAGKLEIGKPTKQIYFLLLKQLSFAWQLLSG